MEIPVSLVPAQIKLSLNVYYANWFNSLTKGPWAVSRINFLKVSTALYFKELISFRF